MKPAKLMTPAKWMEILAACQTTRSDVMVAAAAWLFDVEEKDVTTEQRSYAKKECYMQAYTPSRPPLFKVDVKAFHAQTEAARMRFQSSLEEISKLMREGIPHHEQRRPDGTIISGHTRMLALARLNQEGTTTGRTSSKAEAVSGVPREATPRISYTATVNMLRSELAMLDLGKLEELVQDRMATSLKAQFARELEDLDKAMVRGYGKTQVLQGFLSGLADKHEQTRVVFLKARKPGIATAARYFYDLEARPPFTDLYPDSVSQGSYQKAAKRVGKPVGNKVNASPSDLLASLVKRL